MKDSVGFANLIGVPQVLGEGLKAEAVGFKVKTSVASRHPCRSLNTGRAPQTPL